VAKLMALDCFYKIKFSFTTEFNKEIAEEPKQPSKKYPLPPILSAHEDVSQRDGNDPFLCENIQ
jgi:hypothetical protein